MCITYLLCYSRTIARFNLFSVHSEFMICSYNSSNHGFHFLHPYHQSNSPDLSPKRDAFVVELPIHSSGLRLPSYVFDYVCRISLAGIRILPRHSNRATRRIITQSTQSITHPSPFSFLSPLPSSRG